MLYPSAPAPTPEGKQEAAWGAAVLEPLIPVQCHTVSKLPDTGAELQRFAAASKAKETHAMPCRAPRHAASATSPDGPSSAVSGPSLPYEGRPGSVFTPVHAPSALVALGK